MLKKILFTVFILFVFSGITIGQTTSGTAYIWSTASSWSPSGVPVAANTVTVSHPLTLDQNLTISTGNYTFNKDVTDQPGGTNYNLTNLDAAGSLTIASGTTTIGGVTSIGGNAIFSLTVKTGAVLVLGTMGSTSDNFLIGNKVNITIETGGVIIVYGNVVNSNSSGTFNVNGLLQVYGNYSTNNGNININGTGEFYTSGSMSTQGSGDIYGSGNDCTSNCSGTSLGCGTGGTSYSATILPQSQTVCSGATVLGLTFTTNAPSPTYLWQYSLTAGGTYTDISGATSNTYTPSPLTVSTWYRMKYTSSASGCGTKYSAPVPVYVSASTYTQSTSGQTVCAGTFGPISVSAFGTGLTYQWYSNNSATNSGGTLISGAVSNVYTPSSAASGTKYYYCVINSSCGTPFTTAVSGAFTVNINTAGPASSSPSLCANTLMTNVTHSTTGATGIANDNVSGANGLPSGVSAHWASNTITISGTPTASGTFNYSILLTGGCGSINAVGTITVNSLSTAPTGITGTTTICNGSSTTLTVNGGSAGTGATAQWFTGSCGGTSAGTGNSITVSPVSNTTYYVRYSGTCNTTSCVSVNVIVNLLSIAPTGIIGTTTICNGSSTTLTVNGGSAGTGATAQWFTGSCGGTSAGTGNSITVSPSSNTTYYVRYSGTCNTTSCASVNITVDSVTIAGTLSPSNTNVCSGVYNNSSLTLSGYTGSILRWESSADNFATAGTPIANTGNTQVIGTHTADTYYRVVVQSGGCNVLYSNSVKITVYGSMAAPGGISVDGSAPYPPSGSGISHCESVSTVFSIAPIANASSYTWVIPAGWTLVSGQGTTTLTVITGNNSQSANIEVYASNTGCGNTNSSYLYLHLNPSTAPQTSVTQPSCTAGTGSVTVTSPAPAAGITYTLTGTSPVTAPITNTTGVFTGLSAGVYNLTVNNGAYVSAIPKVVSPATACVSTSSLTINALATKTWNGSWSPAGIPTSNDFVIINANYNTSSNGDLSACSLTVNTGYALTITSGAYVTVQNNLTVNGTLDILDKGSLVMVNDSGIVTNNGTTKVRRITTPFKKNDYIYWSTPVSSTAISSAVFPGWRTNYAYEYNNAWVTASTMTPAKGYIVMVPDPVIPLPPGGNISEVIFNGRVNNGVKKITGVVPGRAYLVGNPYPSALDAEAFLDYNAGVIAGTLYFWTHNTAIQLASNITNGSAGSGTYAYTSDDYASYNAVGGVGVGSGTAAKSGGAIPSGKIGSGQGFFATSNGVIIGVNEIVFNNSMRLSSGGAVLDNSQFFRTKKPTAKTAKTIEKHRIWLNLSNDGGAFKQTLIGYLTGATNNTDARFDGVSMNGNKYIDFYSLNQNKNLVIQGRALPFDDKDEVSLGYKTTVKGIFTINIEQTDGLLSTQSVYLEDKLTHTEFDLKSGNYSFNTEAGTFNDRFVLKYKSAKTLGTDDFDAQKNQVLVSVKNKQIQINSFAATIEKVLIYDISGRQIFKNEKVNSNEFTVADFIPADQVLIVKTTLQNGAVTKDKIIF